MVVGSSKKIFFWEYIAWSGLNEGARLSRKFWYESNFFLFWMRWRSTCHKSCRLAHRKVWNYNILCGKHLQISYFKYKWQRNLTTLNLYLLTIIESSHKEQVPSNFLSEMEEGEIAISGGWVIKGRESHFKQYLSLHLKLKIRISTLIKICQNTVIGQDICNAIKVKILTYESTLSVIEFFCR